MKTSFHLPFLLTLFSFLGAGPAQGESTIVLTPERAGHAATRLSSGKVLITGGTDENAWLNSALLYNPSRGTFTPKGNTISAPAAHTPTLLSDGPLVHT